MPLHTIPLCDFKYTRDIYSGATFKYDAEAQIFKTGNMKSLNGDVVRKIKKNNGKLLGQNSIININKKHNKLLRKFDYDFWKYKFKLLKTEVRNIDVNVSIEMDDSSNINVNIESSNKLVYSNNSIEFDLEKDKNLKEFRNKYINKNNPFIYCNSQNLKLNLIENNVYVNKLSEKLMDKDNSIKSILPYRIRFIDRSLEKYFDRVYFIQAFLYKNKFYERYRLRDISKSVYKFMYRSMLKNMDYGNNNTFNLARYAVRDIFDNYRVIDIAKITTNDIMKTNIPKLLRKNASRGLSKTVNHYNMLDRISIEYAFKIFCKLLDRHSEKKIYLKHGLSLSRKSLLDVNKVFYKNIYNMSFINIYRQIEKFFIDTSITTIFRNNSNYSLANAFNKNLYKEDNHGKFINIIKRWWWMNSTDPRDSLIIPNKDFSYNQELLNNVDYEYLRLTSHPIGWGNAWGTDFNVPTHSVSIEIILDLVNILIMIWHDNLQGWLCCSGKESMQFIMELLYNWYTLETSKPNLDYYRAYRWIRWEAEKVYFLNLNTGLQAIGVLIANLIAYLKNHHFNTVPLWRNPKAMDIERNFNRIAQNGDIIESLNKTKSRRYYYIDTQNIEKKNILGDDTDG